MGEKLERIKEKAIESPGEDPEAISSPDISSFSPGMVERRAPSPRRELFILRFPVALRSWRRREGRCFSQRSGAPFRILVPVFPD